MSHLFCQSDFSPDQVPEKRCYIKETAGRSRPAVVFFEGLEAGFVHYEWLCLTALRCCQPRSREAEVLDPMDTDFGGR